MRRNRNGSNSKSALAQLMPRPDLVVGALADLGLSDDQIGRYFGIDKEDIAVIPHMPLDQSGALDMSDILCRPTRSRTSQFADAMQC